MPNINKWPLRVVSKHLHQRPPVPLFRLLLQVKEDSRLYLALGLLYKDKHLLGWVKFILVRLG